MAKKKYTKIITPMGTAQWPYLNKPDTEFNPGGVYHVKVSIPQDDATELVDTIKSVAKKFYKRVKEDKPSAKAAPLPFVDGKDDEGNPTGELVFKFKMNATGGRGQDQWTQRPKLIDSKREPMEDHIGNGSKIRVAAEVVPYDSSQYGVGVTLRLKVVQVVELREFSTTAEEWGFEEEDGFTTSGKTADTSGSSGSDDDDDYDFD